MIDALFSFDVQTLAKILGFSIGFLWGEAFSRWDYAIKYKSAWYKTLNPFWRWFVASLLDTQHHFQYGLALIIFVLKLKTIIALFPWWSWASVLTYTTPTLILIWMGAGLVASDLKDYEYVLKRMGLRK